MKALIEAGADVNKATDSEMFPTALFQAVDEGHEAIVKMLIDAGADLDAVNDDGSTALALATTRDKETEKQETEAIAKMLIAAGADLNKARTDGGATPLFAAAAWGQEAIVKALIDAGADVNTGLDDEEGETPLHYAAYYGKDAVIPYLLSIYPEAAEVKTFTMEYTPLQLAQTVSNFSNETCVGMLLDIKGTIMGYAERNKK